MVRSTSVLRRSGLLLHKTGLIGIESLPLKREKCDIMEMICMDGNRDMAHYITSPPKK